MAAPATQEETKVEPRGGWCISCGVRPRPKRTNWDRVPEWADPDPYHHRCHGCHEAWLESKRSEEQALAIWYMQSLLSDTPSRHRIGRSRKAHVCEVKGCEIASGDSYWRFVVPGPRSVKVCCDCASEFVDTEVT